MDGKRRALFEVCVDSLTGARVAVEHGADRLELCADLVLGGTTPSVGLVEAVLAAVEVPVVVLVRPRGGDFRVDGDELEVMERDVRRLVDLGAAGVAVGALEPDGGFDLPAMERLARAARGAEAVAHRAFDLARDPLARLEELVELGFARVLTSGGAERALDGVERLAELVRAARGRIAVLAGGGVREEDVAELLERSGVGEVHASASGWIDGPMRHRPAGPPMSLARMPGEHERRVTDPARVAAFRRALG